MCRNFIIIKINILFIYKSNINKLVNLIIINIISIIIIIIIILKFVFIINSNKIVELLLLF